MRAAAIDIGTNSILLLVAERDDAGRTRALFETVEITRLGAGVDKTGRLDGMAVERSLGVLRTYADKMRELGLTRCAAVGTSALRDSKNGGLFTEPAAEILGCPIEVVAGPREAALVRRGVGGTFAPLGDGDVIFDVGGGSTEFIVTSDPPKLVSLDIGTVRLTERLINTDPPTPDDIGAVEGAVRTELARLSDFFPARIARLIGVAGTVTTLATLELEMNDYDSERVNGSSLVRSQVGAIERRLSALPLEQRRGLAGLDPRRADVIVSGARLVGVVMDVLDMDCLSICDRGVRWGLVEELLDG